MKEGSSIINVASSAGYAPYSRMNVYSATKAFVNHFSISLGAEFIERKIKVLSVCPGPVRTEFWEVANSTTHGAKAEDVVRQALFDLNWRSVSIYGWGNQIITLLTRLVPKRWIAWVVRL
jgi:uncharacterized protein